MVDTNEKFEEEFGLAQQLKDLYCDESGKETNPTKAAEIIHQIGRIYRKRSPDKISLIKSAGLFNAAIARNPSNVDQVKSDLHELCQHILQQANANKQNTNLIEKANEVKNVIEKLRDEVNLFLKTSLPKIPEKLNKNKYQTLMSKKISAIKQINEIIASSYKKIMADISEFCENLMSEPPCEYAVAGLGSLARNEVTPYSDFEHIILLEDNNDKFNLNYFGWFSVLFHIVILNLQETIIPSLNVSSLNYKNDKPGNWYYDAITPRGVSCDGMLSHTSEFPLGRTQTANNKQFTAELIKPVSEMLEYLSSDADLKNGYHLADILTKTCFVFGNEIIFKQFVNGAQKLQNQKSQTDIVNDVQQQVKNDLNKYSTRLRLSNLQSENTINIKQLVYRSTTIFIAALARLYNISASSCFNIVIEMALKNKITQKTAYKLQSAIAIACEMRLRVYMKKQCQCDNAIDLKKHGIDKFLNIVGTACTINYFQIAYCLQCEIAKQLNFTKLHFYSDPYLINFTIGLAFGIRDLTSYSKTTQKQFCDANEYDFDQIIDHVEQTITFKLINFNIANPFQSLGIFFSNADKIKTIADNLYDANIYDEAEQFYKQVLELYQQKKQSNNGDYHIAMVKHKIGHCLTVTDHPQKALTYFHQSLLDQYARTHNAKKDKNIATTLYNIGYCHSKLHNYDDAMTYKNRALQIYQNTTLNAEKDKDIAATLNNIGFCHIDLHNYDDALTYLNRALQIKQNATLNAEKEKNIAATLRNIGYCHFKLHNYDDALTYLNRALQIYQNATLNPEKDKNIAETLNNIGLCHTDLHNYDDALSYLNRALQIYQNATLNAEKDGSFAATLHNIGICHIDLHNYDNALTYLNQALQIEQNISFNEDADRDLAITQRNIGKCFTELLQFDQSWKLLDKALKTFQNTTVDETKDISIAHTFSYMGEYFIGKQDFIKAVTYLRQAIKIYRTSNTNANKSTKLATTLYNIGNCLIKLRDYGNALNYLKQSIEVYESVPENMYVSHKLASIRLIVNECVTELS